MTSKTSCSNVVSYRKYILENIKQRGWLMILSFLSLFLAQTVYTTIDIENFLGASATQVVSSYQERFPHMLNGSGRFVPYVAAVILLLAIACAVSGFAYLHSPEKSDFYHGFPLKKTQWFHISYVSGLLIFLIPYLFASLCTMGIGAAKGILVSSNFIASVLAVLSGILGFIVLYNTAILAMMLTGKLVVGTLAAGVLMVYGYMVTHLFSGLISKFLDTHYAAYYFETPLKGILSAALSPIVLYNALARASAFLYNLPYYLLLSIAVASALWLLARHLYQKRPLEAAGKALVYPKAASAIKVMIAIPTALFIGLFADTFHLNTDGKWISFFSILAVILLCGVIEFIYTQDLRQIFKRKCASLVSIAGVAGILAVMQFDLFGYDTWLPEKSKVESMSLYSDSFLSYLHYPEASPEITRRTGDNTALYYTLFDENAQQKEFDSIYKLAEEGIRNHNENITPSVSYKEGLEDYITIAIRFNQTTGKSAYRSYLVSQEGLLDCLNDLCEDEAYRQMLFPAFYIADSDIDSISLSDILSSKPLELTGEQQVEILQAYQTDTLQTDIHKLQDDSQIGSLFVQLKPEEPLPAYDPDRTDQHYDVAESINLHLYDNFENTLQILDDYGYTVRQSIDPKDVLQMTHRTFVKSDVVIDNSYPEDVEKVIPVTDPKEMKELLNRIAYSFYGIAGYKGNSSESLEVWLKGDISARHFSLLEE